MPELKKFGRLFSQENLTVGAMTMKKLGKCSSILLVVSLLCNVKPIYG